MATHGRPTPQVAAETAERPRFRDRPKQQFRPAVNPYFQQHREFPDILLPADLAWKHRGAWGKFFGREAPLHVEIGSGNGFFLDGLAEQQPDWNVLGIELRYKRVVLATLKVQKSKRSNAKVARYHAAYLDDLFEPGSLSGLYVNHPDPWPKTRHEKNRLISHWFLSDCVSLLKPGGWLRLKSDFKPNVDRVETLLAEHPDLPLKISGRSEDVINGPAPWPNDIETNYQRKFREKGEPVYAVEVIRQ